MTPPDKPPQGRNRNRNRNRNPITVTVTWVRPSGLPSLSKYSTR
jgi:hypothetical protein